MFFYTTRPLGHAPCPPETYIRFNSCGWYAQADIGVRTSRAEGLADYQLLYIKSGALQIGDTLYGAGTLYIFRPHEPQSYFVAEHATDYYWIHCAGSAIDAMLSCAAHVYTIGYCEGLIAFCREMVMHYTDADEAHRYYIEGRLLATVAALPPTRRPLATDAVDNAITYINEHYTAKLSNAELAKLCGMSKYHFIRRFTQRTGQTPQHYRNALLLAKSVAMLTDTSMKITDIADSLGFDDSLYFSRLFKKTYGMSPLEYRKRH